MRVRLLFFCAVLLAFPARTQVLLHELDSPNEQQYGFFGWSVAGVPDLDGDARGDLLIGAYLEDPGVGNAGRAYVLSGATGVPLHTLVSPNLQTNGYFGGQVAGVPDTDGDGWGDLLVAASGEDPGVTDAGRVYLFSGVSGMLLFTFTSPSPEWRGGFASVAGVEDVDGDGRGDVLVGAAGESPGSSPDEAGRAYVFSGATGALLHALASPHEQESGLFGAAVAGVADVDGDGRGDVLVGAPWETPDGGPELAGRAYVFSGATGALLRALTSPNPAFGGTLGHAVAGVADADGDGVADLLVGAPGESPGSSPLDAGRAYVFSGATGALLHALASPNEEIGGQFGEAVSGVADADGDGRGDVVVGVPRENPSPSPNSAGRAYVFSGATGALLQALASPNEEMNGLFGYAVAGVPDADGDGRGDVLVGAYQENPGTSPVAAGRAYVFSGDPQGTAVEGGAPGPPALGAPRPNPSGGPVAVAFTLPRPSAVRLAVYDVLGRGVAVLVDGPVAAGRHEAAFDASGLPAGVYVVRLEAGGSIATRTVTRRR